MNATLEANIFLKCPILYRYRKEGPQENLMCFGFEHGDGWYDIIYNASVEIEAIAERMKDQGIEDNLLPAASQIKEKFGTLQIYVHNATEEIDEIIDKAEALSEVTCERCGHPGKLVAQGGWNTTLCQRCAANKIK